MTAAKIRQVWELKEDAVAREDYDEAKRLRDGINRLKAVGAKVAQLEHRKRSAIEAEDYDAAKVIKMEIDKLREAGGVVAVGETVGAGMGGAGGGPERIFNRALEANGAANGAPAAIANDFGHHASADATGAPSPARSDRRPVMEDYQPPAPPAPPPAADEPTPVKYEPRAYEPPWRTGGRRCVASTRRRWLAVYPPRNSRRSRHPPVPTTCPRW